MSVAEKVSSSEKDESGEIDEPSQALPEMPQKVADLDTFLDLVHS